MNEASDEFDAKLLLGRYRVVRKLGQGGMGTVHLARLEGAEGFTKPVVVKRMRPDIKSSEEGNRLFKREAQILSKMHHPSIVNIVDFGVEDGAHVMVLEYVHGYTLAPWLDYRLQRHLPLPVDVCLFIIRKVLDALHYAHHFEVDDGQIVQVVHRDVAPDNVLLSKKGYIHLLDFGVASMSGMGRGNSTKSGVFRGKLGYASPETVHGQVATPRSDLYSAAVLLLELLTQQTPFLSESMGETIQRMVSEVPLPVSSYRNDVPPGLDQVLARALDKEPSRRPESAHTFSRELRRFQTQDDDEVAQQLRRLVREDFDLIPEEADVEPLRLREEALSRVFPGGYRAWQQDSLSGEEQNQTLSEVRVMAATFPNGSLLPPAPSQKGLQGILLGLLVVGGLIAIGLGAAVALLSRSGTGEQVVVVGGDDSQLSGRAISTTAGAELPDKSAPEAAARVDTVDGKETSVGQHVAEPHKSKVASLATGAEPTASVASPSERQSILSRAVQAKGSELQACFAADMKTSSAKAQAHEASLHFSVAEGGGNAQVSVQPDSVARSSLGACLHKVAGQVQFPRLGEPVTFSVPVTARVSVSR